MAIRQTQKVTYQLQNAIEQTFISRKSAGRYARGNADDTDEHRWTRRNYSVPFTKTRYMFPGRAPASSVFAPSVRLSSFSERCSKIFMACPPTVSDAPVGLNKRVSHSGRGKRSSCATDTVEPDR